MAPTSVARSTSSSTSASSRSSERSQRAVMPAVSNTIHGCVAKDQAVQINGDVAGKIATYNFKTMIVNCTTLHVTSNASLPVHIPPESSETASQRSNSRMRVEKPVEPAAKASPQSSPPPKYVTLKSQSNNQPQPVSASFSQDVQQNFISHRIVKRCSLESHHNESSKPEVHFNDLTVRLTSRYVDLSFPDGQQSNARPHKFYVVEGGTFDLLFGSTFTSSILSGAS